MSAAWIVRFSFATRAMSETPEIVTTGSRRLNSASAGGALCIATTRQESPWKRYSVPKLARQRRVALSRMTANTCCKPSGDALMTRSTSAVAFCCSSNSSRSRLSSVFFVLALVLEGLRRPLTFGALGRFAFVVVRRRFFMASLSAGRVPMITIPRRYTEDTKNGQAWHLICFLPVMTDDHYFYLLLWMISVLMFACGVTALTQHPQWFGA